MVHDTSCPKSQTRRPWFSRETLPSWRLFQACPRIFEPVLWRIPQPQHRCSKKKPCPTLLELCSRVSAEIPCACRCRSQRGRKSAFLPAFVLLPQLWDASAQVGRRRSCPCSPRILCRLCPRQARLCPVSALRVFWRKRSPSTCSRRQLSLFHSRQITVPHLCFNAEEIGSFSRPDVIKTSPTPWLSASKAACTLVLMPCPMLERASLTSVALIFGMGLPFRTKLCTSVNRIRRSALRAPAMKASVLSPSTLSGSNSSLTAIGVTMGTYPCPSRKRTN